MFFRAIDPAQRSTSAATAAIPMSQLEKSNPAIDKLVQAYPELKAFLARQAARGAIAEATPGTVATKVTWNLWSHSPASLHSNTPWRDQFVFVYQKNPGDRTSIDFGKEGLEDGKLIGVYRLGDLPINLRRQGGFEGGTAPDGGFETQLQAFACGKPGEKGELWFATGCLDKSGNPSGGWGLGLGYSGRLHRITHGTPVEAPIHEDNHAQYSVLRRQPDGTWRSQLVPKPAGTP